MILSISGLLLGFLLIASTIQYGEYTYTRYAVPMISSIIVFILVLFMRVPIPLGKLKDDFFVHWILFLVLFLFSSFGLASPEESLFDLFKLFLPILMSLLVIGLIQVVSWSDLKRSVVCMSVSAIFFLLVEFVLRLLPVIGSFNQVIANFYLLKVQSPFMVDSNAIGLFALFYFVGHWVYVSNVKVTWQGLDRFISALFVFFIIVSLSRAAITTMLLFILYQRYAKIKGNKKLAVSMFLLIISIFTIPLIVELVFSDGTGNTKLGVLSNVPYTMNNLDIRGALIGYGINEGNYIYSYEEGKYSHLLIPMLLGHFGLFGAIVYIVFFLYYLFKTNFSSFGVTFVIFTVGLSYLHPFLETIFVIHSLIVGIHYKLKWERRGYA